MLTDLAYIFTGFVLLTWGADRFVNGAGSVAVLLGVPPLLIGLTIVGFATSAPEILVSVTAATQGLTGMAVGNALGSNIANIGLVLGIAALVTPIHSELSGSLRREMPALVLLTPATMLLFLDKSLDRMDAIILVAGLIIFLVWMGYTGLKLSARHDPVIAEVAKEVPTEMPWGMAVFWLLAGFACLIVGADLLVEGAQGAARSLGLSDLVIGITIVAIGTSLPELAVSVVAALRGDASIAVGNVVGSNVFNLLAVVGAAGLVNPAPLEDAVLTLHYPVMILFTLALLRIAYNPFGKTGIGRPLALFLVVGFLAYQGWVLTST